MTMDGLGLMTEGSVGNELPEHLSQSFRYTIRYNVAVRVGSKLRFQADTTLDPKKGETPLYLLDQCILDAEAAIDRALSARYKVPLATDYEEFTALDPITQSAIRSLVDALAASMLLAHSFGASGPVDGDEFTDRQLKMFDDGVESLLNRDQAPLKGLTPLDNETDDARPPTIILDNRGANTGMQGSIMDGVTHPVDAVAGRLPRSDIGWW